MSDTQQAANFAAVDAPRRVRVCHWVMRVGIIAFVVLAPLLNWLAPVPVVCFIGGVAAALCGAALLVWRNTWWDYTVWTNTKHLGEEAQEQAIKQLGTGRLRKYHQLCVTLITISLLLLGVIFAVTGWLQM